MSSWRLFVDTSIGLCPSVRNRSLSVIVIAVMYRLSLASLLLLVRVESVPLDSFVAQVEVWQTAQYTNDRLTQVFIDWHCC